MAVWKTSLLASAALLGCACSHLLTVDVVPGSCINPPHGQCEEDGQDSRWLDVRLYQLKQPVDPCKLDLELFKDGREIKALKSNLTDPDHLDAMMLKFPVERSDPKRLPPWEIHKDTTQLLLVALGRSRGKSSARLLPVSYFTKHTRLYFSEYDICLGEPCGSRAQEQCP